MQFFQNITSRKIIQSVELKAAHKHYDKLIGLAFPRIMYIIFYLPHVRIDAVNGLLQLSDILDT